MRGIPLGALGALLLSPSAAAQCGAEPLPDLVAPGAAPAEFYGETVRSDGARLAVGAYGRDLGGADAGAAWIYTFDGAAWTLEGELVVPGPDPTSAGDHFGRSAAVWGERAVVGAYQDDDSGSNSGSAHVFALVGGAWTHLQELHASDPDPTDRFGRVVALRGEWLFVGAPFDDEAGPDAGAAYAFREVGGAWVQQQKLTPPGAADDDRFGKAFSLGEARVAIGSSRSSSGETEAGEAFVYRLDGGAWVLEAALGELVPPAAFERFGVSVAIEGAPGAELCVVGAPEYVGPAGRTGAAYVYRNGPGGWSLEARLLAGDAAADDFFGWTVDVDGGVVVVGAPFEGEPGLVRAGAVYVYQHIAGEWRETQKVVAAPRVAQEELASSFAWRAGRLSLGAHDWSAGAGRVVALTLSTDCAASYCDGDEGAVPPCPCGNPGAAGEGCANSTGAGARLVHTGSTRLAAADLTLSMTGLPSGQSAVFFSGLNAIAAPFADGLRCAGGALLRSAVLSSGAAGSVSLADALGAGGLCAGAVEVGATRHLQGWYRDPSGPCGGGSNLSNAIAAPIAP